MYAPSIAGKYDCFVGNIEYGVTEEQLVSIFSEVGVVLGVKMKSTERGPSAGYGFVEFEEPEAVRLPQAKMILYVLF